MANETRCVHCLEPLGEQTADHVFPGSWYPDTTPNDVQRWTVPSRAKCNNRLGRIEKDLLVKLGMCIDPALAEGSGIPAKALRSVGICAGNLSEREKYHRGKHKQKILAEMKSYAEVKGKPGILPGFGFHGEFPEEIQSAILVPAVSLITVVEKIARGLEFKIAGKYVEPPYVVRTYFIEHQANEQLADLFAKASEARIGPGFKVFRIAATDNPHIVIYRMIVWGTLIIHVCIDEETAFDRVEAPT